jgi:hypothetical protein
MTPRWPLAVLALAACTDVRQIVLSIDTTAGVPCDIDAVRIRATSSAATTVFERSLSEGLPLSITLLDDTPDGAFTLEVAGVKGDVEVMSATGSLQFAARDVTVPVVLYPGCAPGAPPCELSPEGAAVTARYQCGPDVARYGARATLETFQDACSASGQFTGRVLTDGSRGPVRLDELAAVLPDLGFQFFGKPIQQVWVHRDGYIAFSRERPDPGGNLEPGPLDRDFARAGPPPPPRSVLAFWDRLSLRVPVGVCYDFRGDSGTHVLRVTWQRACLTEVCTTDNLNFTITLDQASQTVMLAYDDMVAGSADRARGATATVGLVGDAVRCAASECSPETGLCADGATPCGYTQVFSRTIQPAGVQNVLFAPIVDPE